MYIKGVSFFAKISFSRRKKEKKLRHLVIYVTYRQICLGGWKSILNLSQFFHLQKSLLSFNFRDFSTQHFPSWSIKMVNYEGSLKKKLLDRHLIFLSSVLCYVRKNLFQPLRNICSYAWKKPQRHTHRHAYTHGQTDTYVHETRRVC